MALALSIQNWRNYLLGRLFKVFTDQRVWISCFSNELTLLKGIELRDKLLQIYVGSQWRESKSFPQDYDSSQKQKYSTLTPGGLLPPLEIPEIIWDDFSMDFNTRLPKSWSFEAIMVVVDRLSKYSNFILLKHPHTAKTVTELFSEEMVKLHGVPN